MVAALLSGTRVASAEPPALDGPAMTSAMHTYFEGEKDEGVVFFGAGFTALAGGSLLYTRQTDFARGMMYPVVTIGVLELVVGAVVHFRTDAQVAGLDHDMATDASAYRMRELDRIRKVNTSFKWLKWIELGLTVGGTGVAIFAPRDQQLLKGIGVGLAVQGVVMLTLDVLAARRAEDYTTALEGFRF